MSELDDALAAYHKAAIILRDTHLDLGLTRAAKTTLRAEHIRNAYAQNTPITAARELADAHTAHLDADIVRMESEINAQLATLRWLDQLIANLHRTEVRDMFHGEGEGS